MPDLVDCTHLAVAGAVLERVYELRELSRLEDLLADPGGELTAIFSFVKSPSGRAAAKVSIEAAPRLVCQRCLQPFALPVTADSEVEFAAGEEADADAEEREFFRIESGQVSLRDLAEEELLLALPLAPACSTPLTCGRAPRYATADETPVARRPFGGLQDLLKKT